LKGLVAPGDLVITLGAGDVWKAGDALIELALKSGTKKPPARRKAR
jgi:hypothetical protein